METKTNSQTLSVGVVGTGGMGTRHALDLHRAVGRARVAAIYDFDQDRARQVAEWVESIQEGRPFRGATRWDGYRTMLITGSWIESFCNGRVTPLKKPDKPTLYP